MTRVAGMLLGLVALLATAATGAPAVRVGAAGAVPSPAGMPEAHAWLVVPAADAVRDPGAQPASAPSDPVLLLHMPPRRAALHGGVPGIGRRSRSLDDAPLGVAAMGRRVYLLTESEGPDGLPRLLVRSIEALPTPVESIWTDAPKGRMDSLPPLATTGVAVGFAATDDTLGVLIREGAALSLARFDGDAWASEPMPVTLGGDAADDAGLFGSRDGFVVVAGDTLLVESGDGWASRGFALPAGALPVGVVGSSVVAWRQGERRGGGEGAGIDAEVLIARSGREGSAGAGVGASPLASLSLPGDTQFIGLVAVPDGAGRLIAVLGARDADDAPLRYAFVEVSLSTGEILYDGPLERVAPVSPEEFKILAAAMVVMMVVSLMVVLRPVPRETELTIPEGCALASPARRLLATLLDVAVCALIVARIFGVPFAEIIGLSVLLRPDDSWLALPAVLALGFVYGSLSEAAIGATLGKLAMGCRAVRVAEAGGPPRRVSLGRAVVRNAVKWILPPAASLALIEPTGRHRGDLIAGTVIVVALDDDGDAARDADRADDR